MFTSDRLQAHRLRVLEAFIIPLVAFYDIHEKTWSGTILTRRHSASVFGYAAIPWVFVLPLLTQKFGRKVPFYLLSLNAITSYILLYCSTTLTEFFVSEIIASMALASHTTVTMLIIAEYTSPRYRGVFLTMKSAIMYWGIWVGNAVGTFSHWRNVGLIGLVCCVYSGTALLWPESPYWLASKGRYQECVAAHHWLKGSNSDSERELKMLIESKKNYVKKLASRDRSVPRSGIKKFMTAPLNPEFYKPMLISFTLLLLYHCSGKMVCSMYILEIVKEVTASEATAYMTMLILDGVTVFGMYLGCGLAKFLKRRTLLLGCATIGIMFLYTISIYLYLIRFNVIAENKLIIILLLTGFSIFISVGPMLLITSVYAEIIPLKYNHITGFIGGMFDIMLFAIFLKVAPYLFQDLGLHGSFLFYGTTSSVLVFVLYNYLPETKDKTLQEIALYFKDKEKTGNEELNELT